MVYLGTMELTINEAKFNIYTDSDEYADELGDGVWTFSYREVKRIAKKLRSFLKCRASGDIEMHLDECEAETDAEELGDACFSISSPDEAIAIVAAMIHLGGEWSLNYQGSESEYWFWHDMHHAEHDTYVDERDGHTTLEVSEGCEMHAMIGGAERAKANGVPIADIARQLVKAEQAWSNRFGSEQFFLEDFLTSD